MSAKTIGLLVAIFLMAAMAGPTMAQSGGSGFSIAGNTSGKKVTVMAMTPEQARQRRLENIQQALAPTDEEWTVLGPKIDKILGLLNDAGIGGGGMGRQVGGSSLAPTQNPDGSALAPVQFARADLQNTLQDQNASPDLITSKLATYRAALAKAKEDLAAAQRELISILTPRQESQLVLYSVLN